MMWTSESFRNERNKDSASSRNMSLRKLRLETVTYLDVGDVEQKVWLETTTSVIDKDIKNTVEESPRIEGSQ